MKNREKIREVAIDVKIYDPGLADKVASSFSDDVPELAPNTAFALEIVFDKSVYQQAEFYQFPVTKEYKGPPLKTEREKIRQRLSDILSEQLGNVTAALEHRGYTIGDRAIIGDNLEDDKIQVILYREEVFVSRKGKRQTIIHASSIIPDRPFIVERAAEVYARMIMEQMKKENIMEIAKKNHEQNLVPAGTLFAAISNALSHDAESAAVLSADQLIAKAYMESDWPLHIRSKIKTDEAEPFTAQTQIDCPEYIVFKLNQGGSWNLRKTDSLKSAQSEITPQGFRYKQTEAVVVLQNLKEIPYSLFAETEDGLVPVSPQEAHVYKKLHVSWHKQP